MNLDAFKIAMSRRLEGLPYADDLEFSQNDDRSVEFYNNYEMILKSVTIVEKYLYREESVHNGYIFVVVIERRDKDESVQMEVFNRISDAYDFVSIEMYRSYIESLS